MGVTLVPSIYFAYMQIQENRIIDHYLFSNNLTGLPINKETAVRVSDQVRSDFNIREKSFVALKVDKRPFLREDVGFLLTYKEGVCGEGARVIVNLLSRLGFDATRITLFNKKLQSAHTLVSVVLDRHEFFVDSINSSEAVNRLLKADDISSKDFDLLHYSDNYYKRREFAKRDHSGNRTEKSRNIFSQYWIYSYEAIPYTKLLTKAGLDVRVFNFQRPNHWISVLAEKPNMIMFIITIIAISVHYVFFA